jgi:hypothetical protein
VNLNGVKAALEKNKKPLAIGGAVLVGGLGLLKARSGGSGGSPSSTSAGAAPRPSGAAVGGYASTGGGAYDSSINDLYNALQTQVEGLNQGIESLRPPTPVPGAPVAAGMTTVNRTGQYVAQAERTDGGPRAVWEVQSDGSMYKLSAGEWGSILRDAGAKTGEVKDWSAVRGLTFLEQVNPGAVFYEGVTNLQAKTNALTPRRWTTNAQGKIVEVK